MQLQPFTPAGPTATLAVSAVSARVALTQFPSGSAELTVILRNEGDAEVFIVFGDATVVATTTGTPIPAGSTMVFSVSALNTHVAAITASGTATIRATSGSGIPYGFGGSGAGGGSGSSDVNVAEAGGVAVVAGTAPVPVGFYNPTGGALLDPTLPAEVVGSVAAAQTDSGKPVKTGGVYNSTPPTYTTGQRGDTQIDSRGNTKVVITANNSTGSPTIGTASDGRSTQAALDTNAAVMLYNGATNDRWRGNTTGAIVIPPQGWLYAAAASGIVNSTTAVTIKGAAGAGIRNYLTGLTLSTDALGAATELAVRDGAGGTVIWRGKLQTTSMNPTNIQFPTPLFSTANTLLEVVTLTAVTGGVYVDAVGYTAP